MVSRLLILVSLLVATACHDGDCTAELDENAVAPVRVVDATTGDPICDATTATDGGAKMEASPLRPSTDCSYQLLLSAPPGTKHFVIVAPGYDEQSVDVTAHDDECRHIRYSDDTVTVSLSPHP